MTLLTQRDMNLARTFELYQGRGVGALTSNVTPTVIDERHSPKRPTRYNHSKVMEEYVAMRRDDSYAKPLDRGRRYLRRLRNDNPEAARHLARDICANLARYENLTGLPHRTLEVAAKLLTGER